MRTPVPIHALWAWRSLAPYGSEAEVREHVPPTTLPPLRDAKALRALLQFNHNLVGDFANEQLGHVQVIAYAITLSIHGFQHGSHSAWRCSKARRASSMWRRTAARSACVL